MRRKFRKKRHYVKHLVEDFPEKPNHRAVNKRHEQRSEADTDKFSEKQQRHRTANGKTRQIKASLEKELVARQKQYEFYRDKLLTFDVLRGGDN